MTRLLRIGCKSTFMVMLVIALSSAAMAQRGRGQFENRPPMPPANAQPQNLYEAMKAQHVSSTLHATDLTADWHVITIDDAYAFSPYYTKGNVLLFGGQQYLIAYHLQISSDPDQRAAEQYYQAQSRKSPQERSAPLLLKDSQLALSLVSLAQSQSFHEIDKFDPTKDIAAAPPKTLVDRRISQSQLKQIGLAIFMYKQDYDEKMPPMVAAQSSDDIMVPVRGTATTAATPVQNRLMPYVMNKEIFLQPTTHRPYLPNYKLSRLPDSKIGNPSQTILFYEDAPDADKMRNVAYADGHVAAISEGEFQYQRNAQGISESGYPPAAKPTPKAKVKLKAKATAKA